MTSRRRRGASPLLAGLALALAALAPTAAHADPQDSDGVGITVDITPIEEPTTAEPTTGPTEEPTTEEPTGGEQPTDAEPTGSPSPTTGTQSPTPSDGPTTPGGGAMPDTGADVTTVVAVAVPLLLGGLALAVLRARRSATR